VYFNIVKVKIGLKK